MALNLKIRFIAKSKIIFNKKFSDRFKRMRLKIANFIMFYLLIKKTKNLIKITNGLEMFYLTVEYNSEQW